MRVNERFEMPAAGRAFHLLFEHSFPFVFLISLFFLFLHTLLFDLLMKLTIAMCSAFFSFFFNSYS